LKAVMLENSQQEEILAPPKIIPGAKQKQGRKDNQNEDKVRQSGKDKVRQSGKSAIETPDPSAIYPSSPFSLPVGTPGRFQVLTCPARFTPLA
jgi:hypothetical protein